MKFFKTTFSSLNFNSLKHEILFWLGFGTFLYGTGYWLDQYAFAVLSDFQSTSLNAIIIFLTEKLMYGVLAFFAGFVIYRFFHKNHRGQFIPAFFAVIITGLMSYVLKAFFRVPRPFDEVTLVNLVWADSYSFPSAHTAVAFALLIPFWRISKILASLWFVFAIFTGFARVYENVHYPSDIAGGIFLGGILGAFFSNPEIIKLIKVLWKNLEFRRQTFHIITGFLSVFAHWAGFLRLRELAVLLVLGLIISLTSQYKKIPIISNILLLFDRPRDKDFPGRGAFYFLLSVFFCLLIFPYKIAYAAILILAVGDSLNHLLTQNLARFSLKWNHKKNIGGVFLGMLFGAFAAQFFVPLYPAIIASIIAIFLETIPFRIGKFYIDDNITVPLVSGGIIWGFSIVFGS